jgi:hypothetical protein
MSLASLNDAQREFTAHLPAVESATRYAFRRRRLKRHDYEEILAEAIAACWSAWVGLITLGRNPLQVGVCGIANQAVRYVRAGRRIANRTCGRGKMDVQHRRARRLGGYQVISYDIGKVEHYDDGPAVWKDWVAVDRHMTPAEAAAFRLDFSKWLESLPERRRQTAELLVEGYGTLEVSRRVGVSAPAITQARAWFERSWRDFQNETTTAAN